MDKREAIEELAEYDGHDIFCGSGLAIAHQIAEPFIGEDLITIQMKDERSTFKGAYFPFLNEGDETEAVSALSLMYQIAEAVDGFEFSGEQRAMMGRGFQFRRGMKELKDAVEG